LGIVPSAVVYLAYRREKQLHELLKKVHHLS